jgi:hypothetical protein
MYVLSSVYAHARVLRLIQRLAPCYGTVYSLCTVNSYRKSIFVVMGDLKTLFCQTWKSVEFCARVLIDI